MNVLPGYEGVRYFHGFIIPCQRMKGALLVVFGRFHS